MKCNNICLVCQKPTHNPKYCSIKCCAKVSPSTQTKPTFCKKCGIKIADKWITKKYCPECKKHLTRHNKNGQLFDRYITLKELKLKMPNINQFHAKIRGLARSIYKSTGICSKCGYDKHTNVCHIKSVNMFDENTILSEVNNISNLVELCPNCHWEFDHPS